MEAAALFPDLSQPLPPSLAEHAFADTFSLSYVDSLLSAFEDVPDPDSTEARDDELGGCVEPARALLAILQEVVPGLGVSPRDSTLRSFSKRVGAVRDLLLGIRRSFLLLHSVHPANKLRWLRDVAHGCNPERDSPDWILRSLSGEHQTSDIAGLRALQFDLRALDPIWFETFRVEGIGNVVVVRSEIHARLGHRASAAWLLQRYAQRCRWLRRDELQKLTGGKAGRRQELNLTRDVALFLFDQGLEVLTEQGRGQQRYDIIGPSLLVEAKVQARRRSARSAVIAGLKQIHNYHTALSQEGIVPDPVLVVFRVSGPHADLPSEALIGNLTVPIVYVDLAPAPESGSRASPPEVVTAGAIAAGVLGR
jgi:hypothetical protein